MLITVMLWFSGVFTFTTPDGTIVVEQLPPGAEVLVDGKRLEIAWNEGKDTAHITVDPGTYQLKVINQGNEIYGDSIAIRGGDKNIVRLALKARTSPPSSKPSNTTVSQANRDAATPSAGMGRSGGEVNLLQIIAPNQTGWVLEDDGLKSMPGFWPRQQVPYTPPLAYEMEMTVLRKPGGAPNLALGCVMAGHLFALQLDDRPGWYKDGKVTISGIDMLDGRTCGANESTRETSIFLDGVSHKVVCQITANQIQVYCDGKKVYRWTGNPGRLSQRPEWRVPQTNQLYVGTYGEGWIISEWKVRELVGQSRLSNGPTIEPTLEPATDAIASKTGTMPGRPDLLEPKADEAPVQEAHTIKLSDWIVNENSPPKLDRRGTLSIVGPNSKVTTSKADYSTVQIKVRLSASKGTSAWVGVGLGGDCPITSLISDAGQDVKVGHQQSNFGRNQWGIPAKFQRIPYDEPFDLKLTSNGGEAWIEINGILTSGVNYNPLKITAPGSIGFVVETGAIVVESIQIIDLSPPEVKNAPINDTGVNSKSFPGKVVSGDWQTEIFEGQPTLLQQTTDRQGAVLVFGDSGWENYDLSFKARREGGTHGFKIFFHYRNEKHAMHYALGNYFNAGHDLSYTLNGTWHREGDSYRQLSEEQQIKLHRWYDVAIKVRGTKYFCYLDNSLIFEGENTAFDHGQVALSTWDASARFKEIVVASPAPESRVLFHGLPVIAMVE